MDKNTVEDLPKAGLGGAIGAPERLASVELDPGEHMGDLNDFELSDAQKIELLETLWSIMGAFARMGFEVDVCGLIFDEFNEASAHAQGTDRLIAPPTKETPSKSGDKEGIA